MAHYLTALIGSLPALDAFASARKLHAPIALPQGLAILPLRDKHIDSFLSPPMTGHPQGFNYLSEQLTLELQRASVGCAIAYVETEYFGGVGSQGAALFSDGRTVFGPSAAEAGPINEALRLLGVKVAPPAYDEFEAVGLNRHRHAADWLGESDDD
jgi:hypothetical protein